MCPAVAPMIPRITSYNVCYTKLLRLKSIGHNSPEYIRVVSEAMKYATIDKDLRIGDPDFVEVPMNVLIDKSYVV